MAMRNLYDPPDNNLYIKYKTCEKEAFDMLFPHQNYRKWSLRLIYARAIDVANWLEVSTRQAIVERLQEASEARVQYSLRVGYVSQGSQSRHDAFRKLLDSITIFFKETRILKEPVEEDDISLDEAAFLRFLENIELLVSQAVAVWPRAFSREIRLSTASAWTSTYLRKIEPIIYTEGLLNPSWFEVDGLIATSDAIKCSSYWMELLECEEQVEDFLCRTVLPMMELDISPVFAPVIVPMLSGDIAKTNQSDLTKRVLRASVSSFLRRCDNLGIDLDRLRQSVQAQIAEISSQFLELPILHSLAEKGLKLVQKFPAWAKSCVDVESLGHLMCWAEIQLVHNVRYFLFENASFQLFAYICERIRLVGENPLPIDLEALFNDQRITGFLWLDGRPKSLKACRVGVERWSDPELLRISGNRLRTPRQRNEQTRRVFENRNIATIAEGIMQGKGAVTVEMIKTLKKEDLEQHLEWELEVPNIMRLQTCLTSTVSSIAGTPLRLQHEWVFLRTKVLYEPELEKQLLEAFMKGYQDFQAGLKTF